MGAINIFLGGTGKQVAEDIQSNRAFHELDISEPIAFDLDPAVRQGIRLPGFVFPNDATLSKVKPLASDWAGLELGKKVGPAKKSKSPGPELSPEHSVLTTIGSGVAASPAPTAGLWALRAHGLAVFSLLFDEGHGIAGQGAGNELRRLIALGVDAGRKKAVDGQQPSFNLVTSTAGGTGAGSVIPLALWLKKTYPESLINLVAVTSSAFATVLVGDSIKDDLAAKGRSGMYGLIRELSFLQQVDSQSEFSVRHLPVTAGGLEYRPGVPLFDRAYWFGGRQDQSPEDAFEEAGALLRVLSFDETASDLRGQNGNFPLRSVGAITAIEYPKLRFQRRLVATAAGDAYVSLRENQPGFIGGVGASAGVSLLDYVGAQTVRPLGAWFLEGQHSYFALPPAMTTPVEMADVSALSQGIHQSSKLNSHTDIPRGASVPGDNYASNPSGWKAYVNTVTAGLAAVARDNQKKLETEIVALRKQEESAFAEWLGVKVSSWLSGSIGGIGPHSTAEVDEMLERLDQDASTLGKKISKTDLLPIKTVKQAGDRILELTNKFATPDEPEIAPTKPDKVIAFAVSGLVGLLGWWVSTLYSSFDIRDIPSDIIATIGIIFVMLLSYRGTLLLLTRGQRKQAQIPMLRVNAERNLIEAFVDQDNIRIMQWLHEELSGTNSGKSKAFFSEIREQISSVRSSVHRLELVYKGLGDLSKQEATRGDRVPAHIHEEVGSCLVLDQGVASLVVPEFRNRVRVEISMSPEHRVQGQQLKLEEIDDGNAGQLILAVDFDQIRVAIESVNTVEAAIAQKNQWTNAIWNLIHEKLGQTLPKDFRAAMLFCAGGDSNKATTHLASQLASLTLPKSPSVRLKGINSAPTIRRMYGGNAAIIAEFNTALAHPSISDGQRRTLEEYSTTCKVVQSLGEQIVFLDLWPSEGEEWAPNAPSSALEMAEAMRTYYGADPGAKDEGTAKGNCFTVLPELLAATSIELEGNVEPLVPAVVARLLGSDLKTDGPTYAELFYLLRAREWLSSKSEGETSEARMVSRLTASDGQGIPLVEYPVGQLTDSVQGNTLFGAGRAPVIEFDAFCEFMRFAGVPLIKNAPDDGIPFPGSRFNKADWVDDTDRVFALQRAVVDLWYHGNLDRDCEDMIEQLQRDLKRMEEDGDEEVRRSWEQAMRRLLNGPERRKIRAQHLGNS